MTFALLVVVIAAMFRIRWRMTVYFLELSFRLLLLSAFFLRSGLRRPRAAPRRAIGVAPVPDWQAKQQKNRALT
jgi:hypothetical protein